LLDPVIAALETMQAKQSTFCAENMQQTLMITLGAAAKADMGAAPKGKAPNIGRSTVVVDQSFCIALFLKGFVLIDTGHPAEAEAFLRRAHEAEPYSAHFLNEYAEWYKAAGQWQRAHDLFADAVSLAEMADDADKAAFKARALRGMGFAEIELGKLDEAEKHMRESQKIDPANTAAQHELDYIASQRKRGRT
jgi:tetratricopeptide (TPR) repeat protein